MNLDLTNLGESVGSVLSVWSVASQKERKRPWPLTKNSVMEASHGEETALDPSSSSKLL